MRCSGLSRVALAATSMGVLAAGATGQVLEPSSMTVVRPDDPATLPGGPISGLAGRGTEMCNGNPVTFTATVLRSDPAVAGVRHGFWRAENFTTASTGDLQATTITWWGVYNNNTASANESFTLRIMGDTGGGAPDVTNVVSNETGFTGAGITRTDTGTDVGTTDLYRYEYTLITPVTLSADTCYWIEVHQEDATSANQWQWATDNDDARYHLTDDPAFYGNFSEFIRTFDPAVCIDVDRAATDACPFAASDAPCAQDVTLPDTTCQGPEDAGAINFSGPGDFVLADDFEVAGTGSFTLSELCWRGWYARTNPLAFSLAPDSDSFSIAVYENDNGAPGTVIANLVQGTDFTLSSGYDLVSGTGEYSASITTSVMLQGGTCYWISIINDSPNTRWGWHPSIGGNLTTHRADPTASADWPNSFDLTTRFPNDIDFNFCMGVELSAGTGCPAPICDPPANDLCSSATSLTVGAAPVTGTNFCSSIDPFAAEPCGFVNMGFGDVWYSVTNTAASDMDLTATTNLAGTMIDSRLSVYCGTGCGSLNCVASDDDGGGANFTSVVTWTAAASTTYFIRVDGYDLGDFQLQVTAAAATGAVEPCAPCDLAPVPDPAPAGTVVEAELCGGAANDAPGTAEVGPGVNGGIWRGTAFADANNRDFDYLTFTLSQVTDLLLTWRSEFPGVYNILDSGGNFVDGFFFPADCGDGTSYEHIALPAGDYYILYLHASGGVSTPNNFFGAPCGTHDEVEITLLDQRGACCLTDGSCVEALSPDDCTITLGGTFQGVGADCGTITCPPPAGCPCELDGNAAQVDVFDLLAFLDLWFANDPGADIDGVAGVDVFDLLAFLDCWFPASAGNPCP